MVFAKRLREGVRQGRIRCSVRIWQRPHVKVGGSYPVDEGRIVVESIEPIRRKDITTALAQESGFASVNDLMAIAKHGPGEKIYLIRFHYVPAGGWDARSNSSSNSSSDSGSNSSSDVLRRIRAITPVRKLTTRRKKEV